MTNLLSDAKLSEESVRALHSLLGETVWAIHSPALEVDGKLVLAETFSLSVENKGWLTLEMNEVEINDWGFGTWQLLAVRAKNPKDLILKMERVTIEKDEIEIPVYERAPSKIFLASPAAAAIKKITIYEDVRLSNTNEYILYGEAIIFHRKNAKRFCISYVCYGIHEQLIFTESETVIDSIPEKYKMRQELIQTGGATNQWT